ncbi:hypothetical protein A2U01_0092301 [Trifolium medium]|uniref:Uncharacterized protein n=1 Tax=Trifolium medium TaxID=97028 RepID=A0A392UDB6_9FABA|nr:hypothetical protein [Trifolium medium]
MCSSEAENSDSSIADSSTQLQQESARKHVISPILMVNPSIVGLIGMIKGD